MINLLPMINDHNVCILANDNCKSSPCQQHGTCIDNSNNTYSCVCPEPYSGQRCDTG